MSLTNNPIELLISLGVNDTTSKQNINKYINKLKEQIQTVDVTLNINGNAKDSKIFQQMQRQIESLQAQISELNKQISSVGNGVKVSNSISISKDIKSDLSLAEKYIRDFLSSKKELAHTNFDLNLHTGKGSKDLDQFVVNVKNKLGEVEKLIYKFNTKTGNFDLFSNSLNNNSIANINKFNETLSKLHSKIFEIQRNGAMGSSLTGFLEQIKQIERAEGTAYNKTIMLNNVLKMLNEQFKDSKHIDNMKNSMKNATRNVEDLHSSLLRVENTYKKTVDRIAAENIRAKINNLPTPNFSDTKDVTKYNNAIKSIKSEITSLASKSVEASRSAMPMITAFKTAMEKFPIWINC